MRTKGIRPGALLRTLYTRRRDFAHHPPIVDSTYTNQEKVGLGLVTPNPNPNPRAITSHSLLTPIAPYLFPSSPEMVFQKEQTLRRHLGAWVVLVCVHVPFSFADHSVRVIEPGLPFHPLYLQHRRRRVPRCSSYPKMQPAWRRFGLLRNAATGYR